MAKVTQNTIPAHLLEEIKEALQSVKYGSIEIFVQNKVVTQITVRNIHKTSMEIESENVNFSVNSTIQNSTVKTR
jgi:hypothetical protein